MYNNTGNNYSTFQSVLLSVYLSFLFYSWSNCNLSTWRASFSSGLINASSSRLCVYLHSHNHNIWSTYPNETRSGTSKSSYCTPCNHKGCSWTSFHRSKIPFLLLHYGLAIPQHCLLNSISKKDKIIIGIIIFCNKLCILKKYLKYATRKINFKIQIYIYKKIGPVE